MRLLLRLLKIGFLLFLLVAGAAIYLLKQSLTPAAPGGEPQVFEVKPGATGAAIAAELEERGLISSGLAFRLMMRYRENAPLRTGHYRIDPGQAPLKILEQLVKGDTLTRKATIPEGLTVEQTAAVLEKQEICAGEEVVALARGQGKTFGDVFPEDLEGYLLPGTYEFPWECDGEAAVTVLTDHFKTLILPLWEQNQNNTHLNLHETVILASLVEREAQVPAERPTIAGVYVNRLQKDMLLQCDATVQYALGKQREVLTYQDLEVRSPYNTYLFPGLPPGPIASPGQASLEAAMSPTPSEYLFYVRNDVKGDGSHVFTRNYSEHQRAIEKYQR